MMTSAIIAFRSTGATFFPPSWLSYLAAAMRSLANSMTPGAALAMSTIDATKERWLEAEVNCIAGKIALILPEQNTAKAQAYFERAGNSAPR